MQCIRDNKVLLQAGYNVIVISPPGVALRYFAWRILKERALNNTATINIFQIIK